MSELPDYSYQFRVADLPGRKSKSFNLEPDNAVRSSIARDLGIPAVRKLRFQGELSPIGKRNWGLTASLGATVIQDCVVTLDPVTSRLDVYVERRYLADLNTPSEVEVEMPEDDNVEILGETIDVGIVMFEALALALPDYPRIEGAALNTRVFTEPGQIAMSDDDAKPFASLAGLRDKLNKGD